MKKTVRELKYIIIAALDSEYGFSPTKLTHITILDRNEDGTYIRFRVRGKEYKFQSYISHIGDMESVWCGSGTIEKL